MKNTIFECSPNGYNLRNTMRCLLILFFSVFSLVAEARIDTPCMGVTTTTLNMRSGPDPSYNRIGQLAPRTEVYVESFFSNDWVRIRYKQQQAYVSGRYLDFHPLPEQSEQALVAVKKVPGFFE